MEKDGMEKHIVTMEKNCLKLKMEKENVKNIILMVI